MSTDKLAQIVKALQNADSLAPCPMYKEALAAALAAQAEQQEPDWFTAEAIRDSDHVNSAIHALLADPTGDNATAVVRSVLAAAIREGGKSLQEHGGRQSV